MANFDKFYDSWLNSAAYPRKFFKFADFFSNCAAHVVSHFGVNCAEFGPVIKVVLDKPTVACIHKINSSFFSQKHADNKSDGINM